jgi:MFS transporter, AAHS family, 3-hydroxyphenylpropionic acid transporter
VNAPVRAMRINATLALCAAAALLEGFDNQSMGVAAPRVIAEFGLSTAAATAIFSAATLGLAVGALIGGRIADHLGRKRTLIASLLLFGVCSALTAMAGGVQTLFLARLLTGLGLGGAMPNFIALSSEATRAHQRVNVVTLIMAAMPFGGALAALVSLGAPLGLGWRSIFYLGGLAPILIGGLMMFLLPEARSRHAAAQSFAPARIESVATALFGSQRAASTLLLWAAFFFTQLVLFMMLNWLPTLIVGLGFTRSEAGWTSVCFNLGGSLGAGFLGYLHAGAHRRIWVLSTYTLMAASLAAVASVGTVFAGAAAACALAGVFIVGAQLILFALAPLYYGAAIRGTGVGAAVAAGRLGTVVGPVFAGGVLASGAGSAAVLLAIMPFVAAGGAAAFALTWREQVFE